jgi:hypothetical protein
MGDASQNACKPAEPEIERLTMTTLHADPTINALAHTAIIKYTDWLNLWLEPDERIAPSHFFNDTDPVRIIGQTEPNVPDQPVIVLHCNPFLDEGGPHMLTVIGGYMDRNFPNTIIQTFDTDSRIVYQNLAFVHTP